MASKRQFMVSGTGSLARKDDVAQIEMVFPRRKADKDGRVVEEDPVRLTKGLLQSLFHCSLTEASNQLGICQTSIKKACRRLGISKWPYKSPNPGPKRKNKDSAPPTPKATKAPVAATPLSVAIPAPAPKSRRLAAKAAETVGFKGDREEVVMREHNTSASQFDLVEVESREDCDTPSTRPAVSDGEEEFEGFRSENVRHDPFKYEGRYHDSGFSSSGSSSAASCNAWEEQPSCPEAENWKEDAFWGEVSSMTLAPLAEEALSDLSCTGKQIVGYSYRMPEEFGVQEGFSFNGFDRLNSFGASVAAGPHAVPCHFHHHLDI